jgi:succinoglycan biosynthesis protein ExoV
MQLYYYKDPIGNFGDDLNPWIWPRLLGGILDEDDHAIFIGIGTLLTDAVPDAPRKVVFGSGAWFGRPPPALDDNWKIYCVRGPLTARLLGLGADSVATDSAALLRVLTLPEVPKQHDIAYMPHHFSAQLGEWREVCESAGLRYIDPALGVEQTISEILAARTLVTEAMHGAIVADALRVPWIPVKAYSHILEFKWEDWCDSLEMKYRPSALSSLWRRLPGASLLARARTALKRRVVAAQLKHAARREPCLSRDSVIESATGKLLERLEAFKTDCANGMFLAPQVAREARGT